jgi:phosphomannomutase
VRRDAQAIPCHIQRLLRYFDADLIRRARLKVVLDSCNGAGSLAAPQFLRALGCRVIELHTTPNGIFPRDPEPTPENLTALRKAVVQHHADVGFAQDADADRLAVIDPLGNPIGEDYTLALATLFVLEKHRGPVVTNLSTTRAIDDIAESLSCPVIRTKIGEANVVEEMIQAGAVVGGEGNGGVILPEIHYCRDSMSGMGAVLQLMADRRKPLPQILEQLPRYFMLKQKVDLPPDRVSPLLESLERRLAGAGKIKLDGLKLFWPDACLHVRASNTEPVVRIVAEAKSRRRAQALVRETLDLIGKLT